MAKRFHIIGVAMLAGIILAACAANPVPLPDDEAAEIGELLDPVVTETLIGLSDGNYDQHARYFDEELRDQIDEVVAFPRVQEEVIGTVGAYQSHELVSIADTERFRYAIYNVVFENDDAVEVQFVFWLTDREGQITALYFNSPTLREAQRLN